MVYLNEKIDSVWDAFVLDTKGGRSTLIIPALGYETQVPLRRKLEPNDEVQLVLKSLNIPGLSASFTGL
jgi:hypothetical protein